MPRPPGEFWVAVHFRWGDVHTQDSTRPNYRAGAPLSLIAERTAQAVAAATHRSPKVHFFSEGPASDFVAFTSRVPQAKMHLSGPWTELIDTLARADVVVGGTSSVFIVGAQLNHHCTVISPPSIKMSIRPQERAAASRHVLVPISEGFAGRAMLWFWRTWRGRMRGACTRYKMVYAGLIIDL